MQCSSFNKQCSGLNVQCSAVGVLYIALQQSQCSNYSAIQYSAVQCSALYCTECSGLSRACSAVGTGDTSRSDLLPRVAAVLTTVLSGELFGETRDIWDI